MPAPPAGVLAFTRPDGALAVAAEDGASSSRLAAAEGAEVTDHSWSPDGQRIAFTRCRGRNCNRGSVYVVDAKGTNERRIGSGAGAVWMPDGRHLLVGRADRPGYWVIAAATGTRRPFTAPGLASAPVAPRLWPDSRWLLHLTLPYGRLIPNPYAPHHARARNWLVITDLATGRSRKVSQQRGWYVIGTAPWSADGSKFTFTRRAFLQSPGGRIYASTPTRTGIQLVARGARDSGAWSPDGERLAFNTNADCLIRVVSVTEGSPARTLPFRGCRPTWGPLRQ